MVIISNTSHSDLRLNTQYNSLIIVPKIIIRYHVECVGEIDVSGYTLTDRYVTHHAILIIYLLKLQMDRTNNFDSDRLKKGGARRGGRDNDSN
jgi:hypothetical protein